MATASPPTPDTTDAMVLVGTSKGLFSLHSGDGRAQFELSGPTFAGEEVYSTCIDSRSGTTRLFTGSFSNHWGPVLRRSDDLGATWTEDEQAPCASRRPPTPRWRGSGSSRPAHWTNPT